MISDKEKKRISKISDLLLEAERPVRVLRSIDWPAKVREGFLRKECRELPEVEYAPFDPAMTLEKVKEARHSISRLKGTIYDWFGRIAAAIEAAALMVSARGTPAFYTHSKFLYGSPTDVLQDEFTHPLELARRFDQILANLSEVDLGAPAPACYLAQGLADGIQKAVVKMFGEQAPKVQIVEELSANALAGSDMIRVRRKASFSDRDMAQLIHHEAYIHIGTSLNGKAQEQLRILGASHPGTTRTQEGLAVFAEFISGAMDLDRLRRLSDRVIAIQMATEGADFIQVFNYFLERTEGDREQSFENTRRVFRGGILSGGAPFTKDVVYLDGLLRVHNFLRFTVMNGRADCLRLLFCGKLDIEDIPALCELAEAGMCRLPKFLPPWASDLRFLISYLGYSSFLNSIDMTRVSAHYREMLKNAPVAAQVGQTIERV